MNQSSGIGLALSGGGARAVAHLGMIKSLEEANITFRAVSGTSAGAILGALYCSGHSPDEILEIILGINFLTTFRPSFNRRSFLKIEAASAELSKHLPQDDFDALKIPLFVTATDIVEGRSKVFEKGELIKPVLASSSIPVIFDPVEYDSSVLVDGGVLDNLPYKPLQKLTDKIIGLHCNPILPGFKVNNWKGMMERSMMMTVTQGVYARKKELSLFLEPPETGQYKVFDFKKAQELFEIGYNYTQKEIENGALRKLK